MQRQELNLSDPKFFSNDTLFNILMFLSNKEIAKMALVSKQFYSVVGRAKLVWELKFKLCFPDLYQKKMDEIKRTRDFYSRLTEEDKLQFPDIVGELTDKKNIKLILWNQLLLDAHVMFLGDKVNNLYGKIFYLLKEKNIEEVKGIIFKRGDLIKSNFFDIENRKKNTMLNLIIESGNQALFDYIYNIVKAEYLKMSAGALEQDNKKRILLHWAIEFNQSIEVIAQLRSEFSNIQNTDYVINHHLALFAAVRRGRLDVVRIVMPHIPALNSHSDVVMRFCMGAANRGYQDIVLHLLGYPTINNDIKIIWDLVLQAIQGRHLDIVRLFIEKDATLLNMADQYKQTLLMAAIISEHEGIVNFLLEQPGIDLSVQFNNPSNPDQNGWTALHFAVFSRNIDIVESVFKKCDEAFFKTHQLNLLLLAIQCRHDEAIIYLVRKDAMIGLDDISRKKLLFSAARAGCLDIVKKLISTDSSLLNAKDECGRTALVWAASGGHRSIVDFLLEQSEIDIHAYFNSHNSQEKKFNGYTAIDWAIYNEHADIVDVFLSKNKVKLPSYNNESNDQRTDGADQVVVNPSLFDEIFSGDEKTARVVLKYFPNLLNAKNRQGKTPLMCAVKAENIDTVKFLLTVSGINLNVVFDDCDIDDDNDIDDGNDIDKEWQIPRTALFFAIDREDEDTALFKLLLEAGEDYKIPNDSGRQLIYYLAILKRLDLLDILLQYHLIGTENLIEKTESIAGLVVDVLDFICNEKKRQISLKVERSNATASRLFAKKQKTDVDLQIKDNIEIEAAMRLIDFIIHPDDKAYQNKLAEALDIIFNNTKLYEIYDELCEVDSCFNLSDNMELDQPINTYQ